MGFVVDRYRYVRVHDHMSLSVPIHMFQEHLIHLSTVKGITFSTLELVHRVGGFTVSKDGDE